MNVMRLPREDQGVAFPSLSLTELPKGALGAPSLVGLPRFSQCWG